MMGGGASVLLNAGRPWLESAKQTEIRLAILLKMLQIAILGQEGLAGMKKTTDGCIHRYFPRTWLIHPELFPLLPGSQTSPGN
jgi:hypothetical protein